LKVRMEGKPVEDASPKLSRKFMHKMVLQEILANTIFSSLSRSIPPVPVIENQVYAFRDTWARHNRILKSWAKRNDVQRPRTALLYRAAGYAMAGTIFPRDSRGLVSYMLYEGEKHIQRITMTTHRLPDKTTRLIVARLLKEKGDALRELKEFKKSYFGASVGVDSRVKHLDRMLEKELEQPEREGLSEISVGDTKVITEAVTDIPLAKDDDILLIAGQ